MKGKPLLTMGARGSRVRLYYEPDREKPFVVVAGTRRRQTSFETRREAEAYVTSRAWERSTITHRSLWNRFKLEEGKTVAPSTLTSYEKGWRRLEAYVGADTPIDALTAEQVYGFPRHLETTLAAATVRTALGSVRVVFAWAKRLELIQENRWKAYRHKTPASRRTQQRGEYREGEVKRLLAELDWRAPDDWRMWVAISLLAIYGARPSEILQLEWGWISDESIILPEWVIKTREARELSLLPLTRAVLKVAERWRPSAECGYVIPGRNGRFFPLRDFTRRLHALEERAGIPYVRYRAGHAFRRGLVGDVADATGDVSLALLAVGDRNLSMAKHYRVRRKDSNTSPIEQRAGGFGGADAIAKLLSDIRNEPATSDPPASVVPSANSLEDAS